MDSRSDTARPGRGPARRALALATIAACALVAPGPPGGAPAAAAAREALGVARDGVHVQWMLRYGSSDGAVLDVYRRGRRSARPAPAVVVVHGGGWRFGDKRRMEGISRALALHGFVAFNVNYALAGRGRPGFPAQPRQLATAVRWVRRNAARFGGDPARIGALGTSAGGHLASLLGVAQRGRLSAGARVRAVAAWSAPFDLPRLRRPSLAPAIGTFLGCGAGACAARAAAASPVAHVSPDDPAMLIVSSEHELVPVGQARTMASRLASAGVPHELWVLPGARHAIEYSTTALGPSIAFLHSRLR